MKNYIYLCKKKCSKNYSLDFKTLWRIYFKHAAKAIRNFCIKTNSWQHCR